MPTRSTLARLRLVGDHRGHRSLQHGREVRIVVGHRVDDEAVDAGTVYRGDVLAFGVGRDQVQALSGVLAGQGEALKETDGSGVAEGVGEVLGEQQAHRPGLTGPQRTGDRVGTWVTEAPSGLQYPPSQLRR